MLEKNMKLSIQEFDVILIENTYDETLVYDYSSLIKMIDSLILCCSNYSLKCILSEITGRNCYNVNTQLVRSEVFEYCLNVSNDILQNDRK